MDKRLTAAVVTGALALGGFGAGLVALPVIASAATVEATEEGTVADAVADRIEQIRGALDGLVSDGTIDDAQADAVAETLQQALPERGHGGHGGRGGVALEEAAGLLGLTEDELREQLQTGLSLAAVADAQGVPVDTLVDGLVTAAREHAAERVADGDITQEEAAQRLLDVEERISTLVQTEDLPLRSGHGRGDHDDDTTDDPASDDSTTDPATPAPSGEATTGTTGFTA